MKRVVVKKDAYYDSVFLMLVTRELKGKPGIGEAVVALGTPMNLELLGGMGFEGLEGTGPGDLIVAVEAADAGALDAAVEIAFELMKKRKTATVTAAGVARAGSAAGALKLLPEANLAVISVPGAYAAREARLALERGLHVMLFSDNVSLEDEIALKRLAVSKGLLLMGPDCGTAIIDGKPLCFANVVRRGTVGLVAASGTGLQEISVLLDRFGAGVSQAIGTGGRDLKNAAVGGMTSLLAIEALAADPATEVIALVSKPPAPEVAKKVAAALKASGKPAVALFLGPNPPPADEAGLVYAANLEEAARLAAAFALGARDAASARASARQAASSDDAALDLGNLASAEAARLGSGQRYLRGLFTGGTLCDETLFLAGRALGAVRSNNQIDPKLTLQDPRRSVGHAIVDLGDDVFTVGKPHPMIEPSLRSARIVQEARDPETAVVLVDVVLGYGSHADPAGEAAAAIAEAKSIAAARGGYLPVVASVTGTEADPQARSAQVAKLEAAGALVMPSNYRAALLAIKIAELANRGGTR